MSKRDPLLYVKDMLCSIERLERYTAGKDFAAFIQDDMCIDAVLRQLCVLGEAANKLPKELYETYHHIPWPQIIAFRNQTIHEYFDLDLERVWKVSQSQLLPLKEVLNDYLQKNKNFD